MITTSSSGDFAALGHPAQHGQPSTRTSRSAVPTTVGIILTDAVPPLVIFFVLTRLGVADVVAYSLGAAVPLTRVIVDLLRRKSFNAVSALVGVFLLASLILGLATADVRTTMARGAVIYLALALVFAGSLLVSRPLMFTIIRYHAVRADAHTGAILDQRYSDSIEFRRAMRTTTIVYAAGFAASGVACAVLSYTLPVPVAAIATGVLEPVAMLVVVVWSIRYLHRRQSRAATTADTGS